MKANLNPNGTQVVEPNENAGCCFVPPGSYNLSSIPVYNSCDTGKTVRIFFNYCNGTNGSQDFPIGPRSTIHVNGQCGYSIIDEF